VDALLAAARQESASGHGTADAFAVAEGVIGNCAGLAAERELAVEVERPTPPIRIGVDADLAERVLQPVVENACRYGRHQVRITVERRNGAVVYSVDDDGPGVADDEGEAIFEPRNRGQAGCQDRSAGAGLGLALARRLARAAAGEVEALPDGSGGRFLIRLPGAHERIDWRP
jgi:two-component system, OmpR family, sensor kinase